MQLRATDRLLVIAISLVLSIAWPAVAATYFVQAQEGNDTNPGTAWQPIRSLSRLQGLVRDGDTVYLSGTFTGELRLFRPSRVRLSQWNGRPQAVFTNSRRVPHWVGDGDVYNAYVGQGLDITAVSVRWGDPAIKDQWGRDKTFLVQSDSPNTPYTWGYNAASGSLTVNLGGENPNDGRHAVYPIEYCLGSPIWVGINLEQAEECVVEGLHFRHSIGSGNGTYGLKVGGKNNIIRRCKSWHVSWHHMTFVGSGSDLCSGNLMEDCECYGFGNTSTANVVTLYSTYHHVTGNRIRRVRLHVYQMLRYDTGEPLNRSLYLDGFYSHTSGQGPRVFDNEWSECTVTYYENPGLPFGAGDTSLADVPAEGTLEELEWTRWPNRVVDCEFRGLSDIGRAGETAFARCAFLCSNFGAQPWAGALVDYTGTPGHRGALYDACYFGVDAAGVSSKSMFIIRRQAGSSLRLNVLNCTFVQYNDDATNSLRFITFEGRENVGRVQVYGSVIAMNHGGSGAALLFNDIGYANDRLGFRGNYYYGIRPGSYSSYSPRATESGWRELDSEDDGAVYGMPALLIEPTRSAKPALGTELSRRRRMQAVHARVGINGLPYAGQYGAWQHSVEERCAGDFNEDSFVNTQDFFDFIGAYLVVSSEADINQDSFVDSQDFFDFITAFFGTC